MRKLDLISKSQFFRSLASLARDYLEIVPHVPCSAPSKFLAHYTTERNVSQSIRLDPAEACGLSLLKNHLLPTKELISEG